MPNDADTLVSTLAKKLAHTDLTIRNRNLKVLTKWFSKKTDLLEENHLLSIWKGLYYCMWMSDKPLVQHDLATQLSKLMNVFPLPQNSLLYVRTFFLTMMREWIHIDLLRLDKFLTLVRKFFEESLRFLDKRGWVGAEIKQFCDLLLECPLNPKASITFHSGLGLHLADIYLESLKKCLWKPIAPHKLKTLLDLMLDVLKSSPDKTLVKRIYKSVFKTLFIRRSVFCNLQLPFWLEFQQTILSYASSPDPSIRNKKELYKTYELCDKMVEKIKKLEAIYEEQELELMDDDTNGKEKTQEEEEDNEEKDEKNDDGEGKEKEGSDKNKKSKGRPMVFKVLDQDLDKRSKKRKRREEIAEIFTGRPMKQLKLSVLDPNLKAISGRSTGRKSEKRGKKGGKVLKSKNGQKPQSRTYLDSVQKKKYFKAAKKEKSAKKKK
eukprot:TRINITY_DN1712_c0_g1_i1.p1 TRINITY_DN1712_c0_g1~~TRINITY_DN1712_c0_g1_i1.p1  ORF type:complete len:449 (-),score=113.53 TRINITY_DN1712_c0_g1_i1:15-1319(-)